MSKTMQLKNKQKGITLIGFVMVFAIIGFFAYVGMRIGPIYSEYYSVKTAMDKVASMPGIGSKSPSAIKDSLARNFYSSYVERVKASQAKVTRSRGKKLSLSYQVQEPFISNLDLLMHFDYSVDLK